MFPLILLLVLSCQECKRIVDGRHDLQTNGIWLQHGWLGDDSWFTRNNRDTALFRNEVKIKALAEHFNNHHIKYLFPHLSPADLEGNIPMLDELQAERFLKIFNDFTVIPWIGGKLGPHCQPRSASWRLQFIQSISDLLKSYPGLDGVQINIEPMPSGNPEFLLLLEELKSNLPMGKILSVAAYPPPTQWHPYTEVHWDEKYFREVARRVDQMVPMMYDTAIKIPKDYKDLMAEWTQEILDWSGDTEVLLGVPAYDDSEVRYHYPDVENLEIALAGIHDGLSKHKILPSNYAGISIYCEWEMDDEEWDYLHKHFF